MCDQLGGVARPPVICLDALPHRVGVDPEVGLDDAAKVGHDDASDERLLVELLSRDRQITASRVTIASVPKTLLKVIGS